MRKSIEEIARAASQISDMEGFWSLIHGQMQYRGVTSALFGVLASKHELKQRRLSSALIWKASHKKEFFDAFKDDALFENDRTADHCVVQAQRDVMFWHDPRNWENASPAEIKRANIERDLDMAIGFSVPSAHFFPLQVGGVGVSLAEVPLGEFDRYWKQEGRELITLCGLLDSGMRGQHMSALVKLTKREKECLTWLAVGYRT